MKNVTNRESLLERNSNGVTELQNSIKISQRIAEGEIRAQEKLCEQSQTDYEKQLLVVGENYSLSKIIQKRITHNTNMERLELLISEMKIEFKGYSKTPLKKF